jgi:tetratricopeptide (TPR) repeat protein
MIATRINALNQARDAFHARPGTETLCAYARAFDELGYQSSEALKKAGVDFESLQREVIECHRRFLEQNSGAGVAINNLGVLLANAGRLRDAHPYFVEAAALLPDDYNANENLRLANWLEGTKRAAASEGLRSHPQTLLMYFDPHGM